MADTTTDRDDLMDEVSSAVEDAQHLMEEAKGATADRARELRAQVESKLLRAKLRMQELQGVAVERTREAARVTDEYVHRNPWQVLGAAAVAGLVLGLLLTRSGDED